MTREEARQWFLKVYSEIKGKGYADENEEAYELAIHALSQINDIKAIINSPAYIQEDVLRYQMICEVVKK